MRNAVATIAAVGITACAFASASKVEVHILPDAYVVDGKPIASLGKAAKAAALKEPGELRVTACPMVATKRITEFMAEIGRVHTGHVTLSTLEPGVPQCPK